MANIEHVPGQHWNETVDKHAAREREAFRAEQERKKAEAAAKNTK